MGVSLATTNKIFLVIGIIFQLWFILMYAIDYEYHYFSLGTAEQEINYSFFNISGFILILFLMLLFFLGFTLVNTYVAGSAYSSALFSFLIIVFTVQYYFIIRSFWIGVGLGNDNYTNTLADGQFTMIRIMSTDYRLADSYHTSVGYTDALCCSLAMLIAYMALAGRVGAFHVFLLCFFGVFFYSFNETVIWRHKIADNAYTMRIFLFGSSLGLVSALILRIRDKVATIDTLGYFASRHTRTYGLIGAIFVWLFMPILAGINTLYNPGNTDLFQITYLFPSIMTMWFALSASACASYCFSILLGRRIHPHDIVYSSFTGGIAWGATSTLNPDPFPAILIGLLTGALVTIFNHKLKKPLNNPEVTDTHGTLYTFFAAGFIGAIYSAIMCPIGPFGADLQVTQNIYAQVPATNWLPSDRDRFGQGALQVVGTFVSIAMGIAPGIVVGLLSYLTSELTALQVFNDSAFAELADEEIEQPAGYVERPVERYDQRRAF